MTAVSNTRSRQLRVAVATGMIMIIALFCGADTLAIDGNYSSPYASQWDTRAGRAPLPDATLAGMLLVGVNLLLIAFYSVQSRRRQKRTSG